MTTSSDAVDPQKSTLDKALDSLEKIAKIISLVALPIVVAVVGWWMQNSLAQRTADQEYVKLAVTIINDPESHEAMKEWAVNLLDDKSPTDFTPQMRASLISGQATLPFVPQSDDFSVQFSPDGQTLTTGSADGTVRLWSRDGQLLQTIKPGSEEQ